MTRSRRLTHRLFESRLHRDHDFSLCGDEYLHAASDVLLLGQPVWAPVDLRACSVFIKYTKRHRAPNGHVNVGKDAGLFYLSPVLSHFFRSFLSLRLVV